MPRTKEFRLVTTSDGRVVPEDLEAANRFPPDQEPIAEDPGPVPPLDSPVRAEWDDKRAGAHAATTPGKPRRP